MFPVVSGRENISEAVASPAAMLIDFENVFSGGGYSFLACLTPGDRARFISGMSAEERLQVYQRRSISICTWLNVLKRVRLERTYKIYRLTYVGENVRGPPTTLKTNEMCLFRVRSGARDNPYELPNYPECILLVHHNRVSIDVDVISRSGCSNAGYAPDKTELFLV